MSQQAILQTYFQNHSVKKLNLGCGPHILNEWLNTDYSPQNPAVMFLDASQGFPFEDQTFDYIFSEHMIEHISYHDGISMLRNCHRILKPNGIAVIFEHNPYNPLTRYIVAGNVLDEDGKVIDAIPGQRGSTTTSAYLYTLARQAAKTAKFSPSPDGAPEQHGTITIVFKLQ